MDNFKKYISIHILSFFGFASFLWWIFYYLKTKISDNFANSYFIHPVAMAIPLGKEAIISVLILFLVAVEYFIRLKINNKFEIPIKNKIHDNLLKTGVFFFILPMFWVGILLLLIPFWSFIIDKLSAYAFFAIILLVTIWLAKVIISK